MAQAPLPPSAGGTLLGSGSGSGRHSLSGLPTVTTAAPARSVPSAPSVPAAPAPVVRAEGTRKSIKEEPEEGEIVEPSKIQTPVVPYRAETHAVISYRPSPPPEVSKAGEFTCLSNISSLIPTLVR